MKFRTTALYFLILVVIGGIYAGMRFDKQKSARKAKESRRVFTFDPQSVTKIEIKSGQHLALSLNKAGAWKISSPIVADVDNTELTGLLSTLQNVEMQRKLGQEAGNLKAFGLNKPSLSVRFFSAGKWFELETGAKSPVGSDRYARVGKSGEVFMISSQAYDDLDKNLTDLRRKELFTWAPQQVKAFQITWRNGDQVDLAREGDTGIWKSKTKPQLKINSDKVDNLLQGLHWLRATNFVPKAAMSATPDVDVKLELKDGKTPELKVSLPAAGAKQAFATSSELPGPVLLPTYFLSSIPHSADSLVDRSLLSLESSSINRISWKTTTSGGTLVRMKNKNWGNVVGGASPKPIKNSWPVDSLLASMRTEEYVGPPSPATPPQGSVNSVAFFAISGKKCALSWNTPAKGNTGAVDAWLEKDGSTMKVQVKQSDIERIQAFLDSLSPPKAASAKK
ncbi:MAG: DUF4340 domain-containing protein [Syntrophobacteraceae bacterium]